MPAKRLSMRKIKEVLRLKFQLQLKNREIARSCSIPHSTVANYLRRAGAAGLAWPLPPDLDEAALGRRLFGQSGRPVAGEMPLPDFPSLHQELRRHRHLTLQLLWQEYKQAHPDG
jgi:transposase